MGGGGGCALGDYRHGSHIESHKAADVEATHTTGMDPALLARPRHPSDRADAGRPQRALQQQRDEKQQLSSRDQHKQVRRRCGSTRGAWCMRYHAQEPIGYKPAPRGYTPCPGNCSGVGNCNYDTGLCDYPAGYTGDACHERLQRPCTNRHRESGALPAHHINVNRRDLDWSVEGWMASRCPGQCDDTLAVCYCDSSSKVGLVPITCQSGLAPSLPRILPESAILVPGNANLNQSDPKGGEVKWGSVTYDDIYGPKGWCNADEPIKEYGCLLDGHHGPSCELRHEMFCPNQCSGRGDCWLGFCTCHQGWYGMDCARKIAGAPIEPAWLHKERPWLHTVVVVAPEAEPGPSAGAKRMRPLIYVYDLPSEFTTRILQYRVQRRACVHRLFGAGANNTSVEKANLYGIETYLHETLLGSEHRTFDPDEADFFYVPVDSSCFMYPVFAYADFPWYHGPSNIRPMQAAHLLLEAKRHIERTYLFWNRTGGRDHVWLALHDEV
ncbi:hypothetical protein FOA52_005542 [Chlamydomonas sp. UWO 241]|nr:hypothetical protein FOA52_005542 [Chlamydomonas sp. UWO 241]